MAENRAVLFCSSIHGRGSEEGQYHRCQSKSQCDIPGRIKTPERKRMKEKEGEWKWVGERDKQTKERDSGRENESWTLKKE